MRVKIPNETFRLRDLPMLVLLLSGLLLILFGPVLIAYLLITLLFG